MHAFSRTAWGRRVSWILLVATVPGVAAAANRTIDGSDNNAANPTWGQAGAPLLRLSPVDYPDDGSGATMLLPPDRPNARAISNKISSQVSPLDNSRGMTNGVWQWGQFIDHDIDLTGAAASNGSMLILSPSDPYGVEMIPFNRSNYDSGTGSVGNPRQQINQITSYLDGSVVYGSDLSRASALRTGINGTLKMSGAGSMLPLSTDDAALGGVFMDDGGLGASPLFVAGDVRANEQIGLTAIQTLFAREHNRLAGHLKTNNPGWDDDQIYQTARKIVGAEVQAITYNEFLPAILGSYAPRAQDYVYDGNLNATIATEFSTGTFRFGHTMLSSHLYLMGDSGASLGALSLRESFFNPSVIQNDPSVIDHVLMGLAMTKSQEIDTQLVDDVRNFLFTPDAGPGIDLASLNIQRGRDHGLADYNTVRTLFKDLSTPDPNDLLPAVTSFADITSDVTLQNALAELYDTVDNVDLWVGALAEDHIPGTSVGPTILASLVDQFTRLRDGDSFFFYGDTGLESLDVKEVMNLESLTFMDIMVWNTDLEGMPPSFFMSVPEPATLVLGMLGVVAMLCGRKRCTSAFPG